MKKYFSYQNYLTIFTLLLFTVVTSCKKFVEVPPPGSEITGATVYSNNGSAASVMTGLYSNMISNSGGLSSGPQSIGFLTGMGADELTNYSPTNTTNVQFYHNALSSYTSNGGVRNSNYYYWTELYKDIYTVNAVLTGLEGSTGTTAPVRQQLMGEAKFIRAFMHFYATNLYGDVPLVKTTTYQTNNTIARSPQGLVYGQIIADLKDAQSKLSSDFVDATGAVTTARIRPNQGAATALLARAYLYTAKWDSAAFEASKLINNSAYQLDTLNGVFLANSLETIWQLEPNALGIDTWDGLYYVAQGVPSVGISSVLLKAFEPGDNRAKDWIGSINVNGTTYYYPYKYKVWQRNVAVTEYTTVLRLGEQYLIRAEAEANGATGGLAAAIADLNVIRNRAGLLNYSGPVTTTGVLAAIMHERQVELFTELGHRWFDLKRTNEINSVMGSPGNECAAKGGTWNPDWALLPIPFEETQINPKLTQNHGY